MQRIENLKNRTQLFIFDLEFIGDVRNLHTCHIWEIAVYSVMRNSWFSKVVDPDKNMQGQSASLRIHVSAGEALSLWRMQSSCPLSTCMQEESEAYCTATNRAHS